MPRPKELTPERRRARELYENGNTLTEISKALDVAYGTVRMWRKRDKWDEVVATQIIPNIGRVLEPALSDNRFVTALEKLEPLLDVEDVLGRHKRTTKALQSVVIVITQECQRRANNYRAAPDRADWEGLAKLTQMAINMNAQCMNQEVFIHQSVADRATAIVQRMSPEELEAME